MWSSQVVGVGSEGFAVFLRILSERLVFVIMWHLMVPFQPELLEDESQRHSKFLGHEERLEELKIENEEIRKKLESLQAEKDQLLKEVHGQDKEVKKQQEVDDENEAMVIDIGRDNIDTQEGIAFNVSCQNDVLLEALVAADVDLAPFALI